MAGYIGAQPFTKASYDKELHTATAGQTTFNVSYNPNFLDVLLNGVEVNEVDYTATDGNAVVFSAPLELGDEVTFKIWGTFNAADAYTQAEVDAKDALKANQATTYTKTEVDALDALKADQATTYTKTEVDALDTALDAKYGSQGVTQSSTDTTAGRLLKVGDFGVGGSSGNLVDTDLNTVTATGKYKVQKNTATSLDSLNFPYAGRIWGTQYYGSLIVERVEYVGENRLVQKLITTSGVISERVFNGSVFTPWSLTYSQNTILGTVSQSAGVPTGAIIERGSNANGEYVKYADGTLICMRRGPMTLTTSSQSGNVYVTGVPAVSYAHIFTHFSNAQIFLDSDDTNSNVRWVTANSSQDLSLASWPSIYVTDSNVSTGLVDIHYLAIGRWY